MEPKTTEHSEEEYYYKADNLIGCACHPLRSLFRNRWRHVAGKKWADNSLEEFIKGPGKHFYDTSKGIEKRKLESGSMEEWDLAMLGKAISILELPDNPKHEQEREAIKKLTRVRNMLAHNSSKKLTKTEYIEFEKDFRKSILMLGLNEAGAEKLIKHAKTTPSGESLEQWKEAMQKGDSLFTNGNYKKAIEKFNEAMLVPNLSPINKGAVHEKIAACYFELAKQKKPCNSTNSVIKQAFKEIDLALKLNESSWKAHHILAKLKLMENDTENALKHYYRAVAISPGQTEVRDKLESCKLRHCQINADSHMDPIRQPMTYKERVQFDKDLFDRGWSNPHAIPSTYDKPKGYDDCCKGQQYKNGWGVPKNYSKAAYHLKKAAAVGNPGGIYCLALLYLHGNGVKQDIPHAIKLFRDAASKPKIKLDNGKEIQDEAVFSAQYSLGLRYEDGVGVPQDFQKAAFWYKKSAENGCGEAANNLAMLYSEGKGVPCDKKVAVGYWKQALSLGNIEAAESLYYHYLRNLEPSAAKAAMDVLIELGNDKLKFRCEKSNVHKQFEKIKWARAQKEEEVLAFEAKHQLSIRGLTFLERCNRMRITNTPGLQQFKENIAKWQNRDSESAEKVVTINFLEILDIICKAFVGPGSKAAKNFLKARLDNKEVMQLWESGPPMSTESKINLIDALYKCCSESQYINFPPAMAKELQTFLNNLLISNGGNIGDFDMKIRLCVAIFHLDMDTQLKIEILEEGIKRYPLMDVQLYNVLSCYYGKLGDPQKSIEIVMRGLTHFENNVDLLWVIAFQTHVLSVSHDHFKDLSRYALHEFLKHAEIDHYEVPNAYYCMGFSFSPQSFSKEDLDRVVPIIRYYYNLGKDAEELQLPCHLPYESIRKEYLQIFLKAFDSNLNPTHSKQSTMERENKGMKEYLKDPTRIRTIVRYREFRSSLQQRKVALIENVQSAKVTKLKRKIPKTLSDLKSITLQEMNPTKHQGYDGRILNLTIIEDPTFGVTVTHLVVEDDNGDVTCLHIYDDDEDPDTLSSCDVQFGCRLSVINPFISTLVYSDELTHGIKVYHLNCIVKLGTMNDMCRYCGEEGAKFKCSKCKRALYCSRNCQLKDWKKLKHKMICRPAMPDILTSLKLP